MKLILDFDAEKCVSCGACAVACMDQNDVEPELQRPLRSVYLNEQEADSGLKFISISMSCMHCENAPCINACPSGCIYKDAGTGLTLYNNTSCIGCHSCSMACPFGAPSFSAAGKMEKCDGCFVRIQHGLLPACVKGCPFDAIQVLTEEEFLKKKRVHSMQQLVKALSN